MCIRDSFYNFTNRINIVITFNTLGAKQVIRDVGRVLNISLPIINEIAKADVYKRQPIDIL